MSMYLQQPTAARLCSAYELGQAFKTVRTIGQSDVIAWSRNKGSGRELEKSAWPLRIRNVSYNHVYSPIAAYIIPQPFKRSLVSSTTQELRRSITGNHRFGVLTAFRA